MPFSWPVEIFGVIPTLHNLGYQSSLAAAKGSGSTLDKRRGNWVNPASKGNLRRDLNTGPVILRRAGCARLKLSRLPLA